MDLNLSIAVIMLVIFFKNISLSLSLVYQHQIYRTLKHATIDIRNQFCVLLFNFTWYHSLLFNELHVIVLVTSEYRCNMRSTKATMKRKPKKQNLNSFNKIEYHSIWSWREQIFTAEYAYVCLFIEYYIFNEFFFLHCS